MDLLALIRNIEQRYRRRQWVVVLFIVVSGLALLLWPMAGADPGGRILVRIVGGGILIAGWLLSLYLLRWPPFRKPLVANALAADPMAVVWVYHEVMQNMPYGIILFRKITICMARLDRTVLVLRVDEEEFVQVWEQLKQYLPQATFGYSKEKAFMYKTEPRLLLKSD